MDLIAKIRFRRSVGKESISSIARDLNLSRPTVRKHCRTQTEPIYRRAQQPTPRLGAFQERLENWLQTERLLPKAQRRTARRLFEGLQAEGYRGACLRQTRDGSVRQALYMPDLVAIRFNADFKAKYEQLIKAGKAPKQAITAVMRKLIILANALLKKDKKWQPRVA